MLARLRRTRRNTREFLFHLKSRVAVLALTLLLRPSLLATLNRRHLLRIWIRNEEYALNHGKGLDKKWVGLKAAETETWPLEAWSPRDGIF